MSVLALVANKSRVFPATQRNKNVTLIDFNLIINWTKDGTQTDTKQPFLKEMWITREVILKWSTLRTRLNINSCTKLICIAAEMEYKLIQNIYLAVKVSSIPLDVSNTCYDEVIIAITDKILENQKNAKITIIMANESPVSSVKQASRSTN